MLRKKDWGTHSISVISSRFAMGKRVSIRFSEGYGTREVTESTQLYRIFSTKFDRAHWR